MAELIDLADLAGTLGLGRHEHVALVGGGGKTTSLFTLTRQLPGKVIATTTTKMGSERDDGFPVLIAPSDTQLQTALSVHDEVLVWTDRSGRKAVGVSAEDCDRWFAMAGVDHVIVEADGSRQRPFKAPHAFEPVVPATATMVISCIGADALGRVIADQCHRPLRVAAIARCSPYERLTPRRAAAVLLSDRGSRKGLPPTARHVVAIHQVDDSAEPLVDELVAELADAATVVAVRAQR